MKTIGIFFCICSGLLLLFSSFMDVSAPYSDVINLSLLQYQLMIWQLGVGLLCTGSIIICLAQRNAEPADARTSFDKNLDEEPKEVEVTRTSSFCSYCESEISDEFIACSELPSDDLPDLIGKFGSENCRSILKSRGLI